MVAVTVDFSNVIFYSKEDCQSMMPFIVVFGDGRQAS